MDGFDFMLTVRRKNEKKRLAVVRVELIEHVPVRMSIIIAVVIGALIGSADVR